MNRVQCIAKKMLDLITWIKQRGTTVRGSNWWRFKRLVAAANKTRQMTPIAVAVLPMTA